MAKFFIECEMEDRWVDDFCSMLKYMEHCGKMGHSDWVALYADGDGDFRPKFDIKTEYKEKEPVNEIEFIGFDAG